MQYKLSELASGLDVVIKGDPDCLISGVCAIQQAESGRITFLTNPLYRKYLSSTNASAVILTEADAEYCVTNAIITSNPHFTYAKITAYFLPKIEVAAGIHPSVILGDGCDIHPTATIEAKCVIGKNVKVGANCYIGAGTYIGDHSVVDDDCQIDANVSIYHHTFLGKRVKLASGVVVGSDGFGFANHQGAWHKVAQLGAVEIGDDVDIGANTTIDRGAVGNTVIGSGVKLDNLIQIGHNVLIGENTIIAGCVAIAGSTEIGKNCVVGGATCFAGHLQVADNVMLTGMSAVTKSIPQAGIYSSGIVGVVPNHEFRKNNARFHRLENLMQRVKDLETLLKTQSESKLS